MSDEAIIAQVSAILEGWTPTPDKALANRVGDNWLIGGFIDGTCFYKHTGLAPDGPDTPDDPIEAAHWLVAHVAALRGPTSQPEESPATGGVFDSGPALEEIREAYEDSHTDNEGAGDVGIAEHSGADIGGDGGEHVEAGSDADPSEPADFSAEPMGDDSALGEPGAYSGVMISGDPLKAAQMEATWAVGDKEEALVSQYAADENLARLNEMRGIALAIKEGVHPPFDEETAAELQALETFASWLSAVRANADRLRNTIRMAGTIEDVQAVNLEAGWPE